MRISDWSSDVCSSDLLAQIAAADVVVVSKFGKLEAMRQGLWPAFAAAVAIGKPLLTTVSHRHVGAWTAFAPAAAWLGPEPPSIAPWWHAGKPRARPHRRATGPRKQATAL